MYPPLSTLKTVLCIEECAVRGTSLCDGHSGDVNFMVPL